MILKENVENSRFEKKSQGRSFLHFCHCPSGLFFLYKYDMRVALIKFGKGKLTLLFPDISYVANLHGKNGLGCKMASEQISSNL